MRREKKEKLSKSAASGTVALIFLILGFQIAVFVIKVIDRPAAPEAVATTGSAAGIDTVKSTAEDSSRAERRTVEPQGRSRRRPQGGNRTRLGGYEAPVAKASRQHMPGSPRSYESFPFDPNTVTLEELQRLGLSRRQAESICNYRSKGGKFRRKTDFSKMYVVSDTLFERLEPFIEIKKLELNIADSAAFTTLHGIGPYYARKIVEYRASLGGFVSVNQLLEIKGFDEERLANLADDITVDSTGIVKIDIWGLPADTLSLHPYIRRKGADAIARFKSVYDSAQWTIERLASENVLPPNDISRLRPYL